MAYRFTKASTTPRQPRAGLTTARSFAEPVGIATRNHVEAAEPGSNGYAHVLAAADHEMERLRDKLVEAFDHLAVTIPPTVAIDTDIDLSGFEAELMSELTGAYERVVLAVGKAEAETLPELVVGRFSEVFERHLGQLFQFYNPNHVASGPHGGEFAKGHGSGGGSAKVLANAGAPEHQTQADFKTKTAYIKHLHAEGHGAKAIIEHTGYDYAQVYGAVKSAKDAGIGQGSANPGGALAALPKGDPHGAHIAPAGAHTPTPAPAPPIQHPTPGAVPAGLELTSTAHYGKLVKHDTIEYTGTPYTDSHNPFLNQFKGQTGMVLGPAMGHGAGNHAADSPFGGVSVQFGTGVDAKTANVKNIDITPVGITADNLMTPKVVAPPPVVAPTPHPPTAAPPTVTPAAGPEPKLVKPTKAQLANAAAAIQLDPMSHYGKLYAGDTVTFGATAYHQKYAPNMLQYDGLNGVVVGKATTGSPSMYKLNSAGGGYDVIFHKGSANEVKVPLANNTILPTPATAEKLKMKAATLALNKQAQQDYKDAKMAHVMAGLPTGAKGAALGHPSAEFPASTLDTPKGMMGSLNAGESKHKLVTDLSNDLQQHQAFMDFAQHLMTNGHIYMYHQGSDAYKAVDGLIDQWKGTSADNTPLALFMQHVANKEFDLGASEDHFSYTKGVSSKGYGWDAAKQKKFDDMKQFEPGARVFLRTMYNHTQAELAARGITEVALYRGWTITHEDTTHQQRIAAAKAAKVQDVMNPDKAARMEVDLQPMSSHSHAHDQSAKFGTTMIRARIPASLIISTPMTGYGCLNEKEWVILGRRNAHYRVANTYDGPDKLAFAEDNEVMRYPYLGNADEGDSGDWIKHSWEFDERLDVEGLERMVNGWGISAEEFLALPIAQYNKGTVPVLDELFALYGQ